MKRIIKKIITYLNHPIVGIYLRLSGCKTFYLAPQMQINRIGKLKVGDNFQLGRSARFLFVDEYYGGKYTPSITIGKNVSIGNRFSALSAASIKIDDNCLIASDVLITSENHGIDPLLSESYANIPLNAKPVHIHNGCWIGEKVSILPGVEIGERCIVSAGAVVTKSFPAYSIIAGVPAKIIKVYDFDSKSWVKYN